MERVLVKRNVGRLVGVAAVVMSLTCMGTVGAVADEGVITDQPYVEFYGFKNAHAKGLDGSGVTIAVLDGWVDKSVPELAGADIESVEKCDVQKDPFNTSHATTVASILVSKDYGWVPKAKLLTYPITTTKTRSDKCRWETWDAIHDALSKEVDIITIQITGTDPLDFASQLAVLRAARLGVPVVWGAGNNGDSLETSGMQANGAIAVASHTLDGTPSEWATYGDGMTISAVGEEITLRDPDETGRLTRIVPGQRGTSFSAPMVAGALALGVQKWPDASGNQLIRALIETAIPCTTNGGWSKKCGYGIMDIGVFSKHPNPGALEDSNPLMKKQPVYVKRNQQLWRDYEDGVFPHSDLLFDTSYTYRGTEILEENGKVTHPAQIGSSPRYMKRVTNTEKTTGLLPESK